MNAALRVGGSAAVLALLAAGLWLWQEFGAAIWAGSMLGFCI